MWLDEMHRKINIKFETEYITLSGFAFSKESAQLCPKKMNIREHSLVLQLHIFGDHTE